MSTRLRNVGRNESKGPSYVHFKSSVTFLMFVQTKLGPGCAISRLKVLNSSMYMGFITALGTWNTQNQLAVTFGALTLIGDWEKMLEHMVFIGISSSAQGSPHQDFCLCEALGRCLNMNGDTVWKVWASYHLTHEKNTLLRFAWAVSCHNIAHAQILTPQLHSGSFQN